MSEIYAAQDANQFPALLGNYGNAGTSNGTSTPSKIAADQYGNIYVSALSPLVPSSFDAIVPTFGTASDVWTFLTGGTAGGTVSVITVNYSDSTKGTISNITKT